MNIPLLKRVKQAILKRPGQFEMGSFFSSVLIFDEGRKEIPASHCGTAACIAGWAVHIEEGKKRIEATRSDHADAGDVEDVAIDLLMLSESQTSRLFYNHYWPDPFPFEYNAAKTPLARAKVAAARISHFIKTKGAE